MFGIKTKKNLNVEKSINNLKKLSFSDLEKLSQEIRNILIRTISQNGGHLAPNLGTVELSIALHYCFNSPTDKIIFDVGHQSYVHKILTGRLKNFGNIRKQNGLSGYPNREESEHDPFGNGHVGSAVSAALGFAQGRDLKKQHHDVVAVIGDGSLTNGETFEGINNAGASKTDITIVLNDNNWSISKNVGGIAKYLEKITDKNLKNIESIFELLGFKYFGPVNGHNIAQLTETFEKVKKISGPKIVHVITKKGSGYSFAEEKPDKFHFTNPFVVETGDQLGNPGQVSCASVFGNAIAQIAEKNKKVVAITAAMTTGNGLSEFAKKFPDRFFDVGIAEEHAVTFAAGLALSGLRPVVAIYSIFLQRTYDQIIHDVILQKAPVVFAVGRAGIGTDGPTHQGLFDLSYLRSIPNLIILAPKDEDELREMLFAATKYEKGPIAIRYPAKVGADKVFSKKTEKIKIGLAEKLRNGKDGAILAIGSMVFPAMEAAKRLLEKNISVTIYNARSAKPLDVSMIKDVAKTGRILTVEENILEGGFGSAVLEELEKLKIFDVKVKRMGINGFVEHGDPDLLKAKYDLNADGIIQSMTKLLSR